MRCHCRKKSETTAYADCCGPLHGGVVQASTAEALMRSRYAAFALQKADYLLATWHPDTRPARIDFNPGEQWIRLQVVAATEDQDSATVEFIARSKLGGRSHVLHEVSRFHRISGRWFYCDGVTR